MDTEIEQKTVKIAMIDSNLTKNIKSKYIKTDEETIKNCMVWPKKLYRTLWDFYQFSYINR